MQQLAAEAEAERQREAAALLRDLGRAPSYSECVLVEQVTALIVRGRRLRQAGRGAEAEMVSRLILRGLTKLGAPQGPAKPAPHQIHEYLSSKYGHRGTALSGARATEKVNEESNISESRGDDEGTP
jgi:hypothetical protein